MRVLPALRPPLDPALLRRRRLEQLAATLRLATDATTAQLAELQRVSEDWLDAQQPNLPDDALASVAARLQQAAPTELQAALSLQALTEAFGRSLLQRAHEEVALEAHVAGHGASFESLSSWVQVRENETDLGQLSLRLGRSPSDLQTALRRLRHRLLQRIDAGLVLWSNSPESQRALRRQLHAVLTQAESMP